MSEPLDEKARWVLNVLGIDLRRPDEAAASMATWKAARDKAVASLHAVADAAEDLDFVDAPQAVILLRGLAANLTKEPSTANQVAELERYLTEEELIDEAEEPNGFGIEISLRAPLLAALAGLRRLHESEVT